MGFELGSLADWLSGIGGVLAATAAVVAWRLSRRMLEVEEKRDADAEARGREISENQKREQAGLIFALGAKLPNRDFKETWAVYLFNGSSKPVYNVKIASQRLNGIDANRPIELGALPPGRFAVPSHPQYHWGNLIDLSMAPEPVDLLVKGNGNKMITLLEFVDAEGAAWRMLDGTELQPRTGLTEK